jgi:hypothetical protein
VGQTTAQIASHIDITRDELKANVEELESKVKAVTDWRQQYQKHAGAMIAVAIGGGVILSAMLRGADRTSTAVPANATLTPASLGASVTQNRHDIFDAWNIIKGALIGVAATKFKGILGDAVPGFAEQLEKTERERASNHGVDTERTH